MNNSSRPLTDVERAARDWVVLLQLGDRGVPAGSGIDSQETGPDRAANRLAFERWRDADPAHAEAFEKMKRALDAADVMADSKLVRDSRLHRAPFAQRVPYRAAIAASAVLAVLGGYGLYRIGEPDRRPTAVAQVDRVYATAIGQRRDLNLPDGSVVKLDTDTLLRVRYDGARRWMRLDHGRAFFEVAHDAVRPFVVAADDGEIVAHGTAFEVSVSAKGVRVALIQGVIDVRKRSRDSKSGNSSEARRLEQGQQVTFTPDGGVSTPQPIQNNHLEWRDGRLIYENARLDDAVDEINRYNLRKIRIDDPAVAALQVSGGYDPRDPLAFAETMAAANDLSVLDGPEGSIRLAFAKDEASPIR